MNIFKFSISLILLSVTFLLFSSCSRADDIGNENVEINSGETPLLSSLRMQNFNEEEYQNMIVDIKK